MTDCDRNAESTSNIPYEWFGHGAKRSMRAEMRFYSGTSQLKLMKLDCFVLFCSLYKWITFSSSLLGSENNAANILEKTRIQRQTRTEIEIPPQY
ncbi:hypothetical protein STEG23_030449 [Scotinomys teguina]